MLVAEALAHIPVKESSLPSVSFSRLRLSFFFFSQSAELRLYLFISMHIYVDCSLAMATPEINLAEDDLGRISEGTIFDDDSKADFRDDLTSDSTEKNQQENVLDRSSPIIYHYLLFETTLPLPSTSISTHPANPSPPPQPGLKKFTSPFDWPESRKNFMVWLSCIATLITAYTAGSYSPAVGQMTAEWNVSEVAALVGITSFCCGFAIAPMVLAPFSEIQGRSIPRRISFTGYLRSSVLLSNALPRHAYLL
jgi:hypothetical protein